MIRLLVATFALILFSCGDKEQKFDTATYEEAKESIQQKESKNPEQFLSVTSSDRENWIGKKVITGVVHNRATVCTYRDVELNIKFLSKEGEILKEDSETIKDFLSPGQSKNFKFRYAAPKKTDDIRVTIVGAEVEGN
jgi:hypothetical protein